jgi:hypothetical protein
MRRSRGALTITRANRGQVNGDPSGAAQGPGRAHAPRSYNHRLAPGPLGLRKSAPAAPLTFSTTTGCPSDALMRSAKFSDPQTNHLRMESGLLCLRSKIK